MHIIGEEEEPLHQRFFPELSGCWESLNNWLRVWLLQASDEVLQLGAHPTQLEANYYLRIQGHGGFGIGNYCLGFQLMYYFTMLLIISRLPVLKKAVAIFTGILIIQALNIARISGLVWVDAYKPELLFLSHDYIFNLMVFGILLLFYWKLTSK